MRKRQIEAAEQRFYNLRRAKLSIYYMMCVAKEEQFSGDPWEAREYFLKALQDCLTIMQDSEHKKVFFHVYENNVDFYIELYSLCADVFLSSAKYRRDDKIDCLLVAQRLCEETLKLLRLPQSPQHSAGNEAFYLNRIEYCKELVEKLRHNQDYDENKPASRLSSADFFPVNNESALALLAMNTSIHGFFHRHNEAITLIDQPLDFCELSAAFVAEACCEDSSDESPQNNGKASVKRVKSEESTDVLESDDLVGEKIRLQ
jgi:hypothetical protein